jgi:glucosyl-dolichyl phosphate glucuronosyltransferase
MTVEVGADVVICTYTDARWALLLHSVNSALNQTVAPGKVIIVVDHNRELAQKCRRHYDRGSADLRVPILVVENCFDGRLGSARNTGLLLATADIVAFLDDDAEAEPRWLERLLAVYAARPLTVAVGGAPIPNYAVPRPQWFPPSFDWVFGCHYRSMPDQLAPVRHLIGASMSVQRDFVLGVGGFHADDHDDMDLSHRVFHAHGAESLLYEPRAQVHHYVSRDRLTWKYFWRRCFHVNRSKVAALAELGAAGDIAAELRFVLRAAADIAPAVGAAVAGDTTRLRQWPVAMLGITLAGLGHLVGRGQLLLGMAPKALTTGLTAEDVVRARAMIGVGDA